MAGGSSGGHGFGHNRTNEELLEDYEKSLREMLDSGWSASGAMNTPNQINVNAKDGKSSGSMKVASMSAENRAAYEERRKEEYIASKLEKYRKKLYGDDDEEEDK